LPDRNESAEIFVVCQFYQAPDKIDPKFLDAKYVFGEIDKIEVASRKIMDPTKRKRNRDGYEDGVTTLFKEVKASEFVTKDNAIKILNHCSAIIIDKPWIENHAKTTANIKEYLKDLKVLNIKELRALKKWKDALKADLDKIAEDENDEAEAPTVEKTVEEIELEELNEIDRELAELKEEERRKEKRLKKKEKRAQEKRVERLNLKMVIPGDEGPRADDQEVFKLKLIREDADLNSLMDTEADMVASDDSDDEEKTGKAKFVRQNKDLEDGVTPPWYEEHDDVIEDSGSDAYESDMEPEPESLGLESEGEEQDDDIEEEEEPSHLVPRHQTRGPNFLVQAPCQTHKHRFQSPR
jgi:AdoMet-dependent rRNA methyltransferase SPB1